MFVRVHDERPAEAVAPQPKRETDDKQQGYTNLRQMPSASLCHDRGPKPVAISKHEASADPHQQQGNGHAE